MCQKVAAASGDMGKALGACL